jgi:glyoxylase-like metal-dependent hydrolase (beta-lactamase superfamily II)
MSKITGEIFQVGGDRFSSSQDAAVYLIHFTGKAAVVDAGCGKSLDRIIANIRSHGVSPDAIEYLLLTHCHFDHTGGAKRLRDLTGCRIVAHELDAAFLEEGNEKVTAAMWYGEPFFEAFPVDMKLKGERNEIKLGDGTIEAIHVPGHSPGSVVYLVESEGKRVLFGQDVHGPLHPGLLSNRGDYLRSIEVLLSLKADILCEGHYGVFQGNKQVSKFIRQFID